MTINKYVRKPILYLIKVLHKADTSLNKNADNPNPKGYSDLLPSKDVDKDKTYSDKILWALRNSGIKNIALTGPYGSGKSSIIRSFESKHRQYTYLNISLASFDVKESDNKENDQDTGKSQQLIERSILQQIFYKVPGRSLPDSRFRRIKSLPPRRIIGISGSTMVWLLAALLLFSPKTFSKISWWTSFSEAYSDTLLYLSALIFSVGIFIIIYQAIRLSGRVGFNKVNLKSGEIEVAAKKDETSILNKYLDEILYFFEVNNYNVVIIEDLDRFEKPEIFTKLREINTLINNSQQIKRRVVFIYALKDEMFPDKSRTKFFDFIIPVIPVINSSNSREKFREILDKANLGDMLSDNFINDVALYVDDMRMLKNVVNEYILYKAKLPNSLDQNKLLAMMIYKNLYPADFASLHENKGMVHRIFSKKKEYIKKLTVETDGKIAELKKEIEYLNNTLLSDAEELRSVYAMKLLRKLPNSALYVQIGNTRVSLYDLQDITNFNNLRTNKNITYIDSRGYPQHSGVSFKDVEDEVNPDRSYTERQRIIDLKNENEVEKLRRELEGQVKRKNTISGWSLQEILSEGPVEILDEEASQESLLVYLMRYGYIDETYHRYISYFYEGNITREDLKFVMSIKNREALDFTHELTKVGGLVKELRPQEFEREEVLNHNLIDFLLKNRIVYKDQLNRILRRLGNESEKSIRYIDRYVEEGQEQRKFIKSLCHTWPGLWKYIEGESDFTIEKKDKYLRLILSYADTDDIVKLNGDGQLASYISEKRNFLSLAQDTPGKDIVQVLSKVDVKFKCLDVPPDTENLFDRIYRKRLYEINREMIELAIKAEGRSNNIKNGELDTANYTTVTSSGCKPLIDYIQDNINAYVNDVFLKLDSNTLESEQSVIELLDNPNIPIETKGKIIGKQEAHINDITAVDSKLWSTLLKKSKIRTTWDNLLNYYEQSEQIDDVLVSFLNQQENYQALYKEKISGDSERIESISERLILCNDIEDISYAYLIKSVPYTYNRLEIKGLSSKKIDALLDEGMLNLTIENYQSLKENFKGKQVRLIINNIADYLKDADQYSLREQELYQLLSSASLQMAQKVKIVSGINESDVTQHSSLSDQIIKVLVASENIRLDSRFLLKVIEYSRASIDQVKLFNRELDDFSTEDITNFLNAIGKPYAEIAEKGPRPSFDKNPVHLAMAEKLQKKEYISSYKAKGDTIRINTKRR